MKKLDKFAVKCQNNQQLLEKGEIILENNYEKHLAERDSLPMFVSLFFDSSSSMKTSVSYEMSEEQLNSRVWGEMSEGSLSIGDFVLLTDLCQNASEAKISYLVHMYNDRSPSLEPIEAHFVARYATRRGYSMFTDENGQTKFKKQELTKDEVDAFREALIEVSNQGEELNAPKVEEKPTAVRLLPSWLRRRK